tara:strand:- start:5690 stop:6616 length:927 start_codon:yes stop_codon:yes gene_type:complete
MPYIGKAPVSGGFHKLDNLTASATATYALTLGGASYFPETANQLLVSLNGVIQAPQDSFTVSGSNLIFDSALLASDSIDFVVALGDVLGVGTPTDGTITTAKIGNGAVTDAKIDTMAASKLTGALPAIDGSNLTGLSGSNIKEKLVMLCDGNNYTVGSGTYTSTNVTAAMVLTTTSTDITGSSISYTPPTGTTMVIYEFVYSHNFQDTDTITHIRSFIDSNEVTSQRQSIQTYGALNTEYHHTFLIPIGGSANTATGRQASWTSAKTLKIQGRCYNNNYQARIHDLRNWDGSPSTLIRKPQLIITALG